MKEKIRKERLRRTSKLPKTHVVLLNTYTYTNISGNIVNNNDDFNERTNTLLYKNISLTLYSRKGWCWLCVRGELKTGTDCYILTPSPSDHSSTSIAFWLGCSTVGHWGPKALCLPLALSSASCLQLAPTLTGSSRLGHLVIWLSNIYLLLLFLHLFT